MESKPVDILEHHPKASMSPGKRIGTKDPGMLHLAGTWGHRDTLPLHIFGLSSPTRIQTGGYQGGRGWVPPSWTKPPTGDGSGGRLTREHRPPRAGTAGCGGPIPPLRKSAFPIGRALNVLAARPRAGLRMTECGPGAGTRGHRDTGTQGRAPGRWQEALARSWHRSGLRGLFIASVESPACTECSDLTVSNVINNNN